MPIDTDRLVQIAAELKELDQRRETLLVELQRSIGDGGGAAPAGHRRGRPPGSRNRAKPAAKAAAAAPRRKRRKGLTTDIVGLLAGGGSYTAGDIVGKLGLQASRGKISSVSTTLVRLAKAGRVKKDKERGYRAA